MNITFKNAQIEDTRLLVDIYNQSFYDDYIRFGYCPGYGKTEEEMQQSMSSTTKYLILCDGNPIGVFSYKKLEENIYHIGCLCIIPKYQNKGIGTIAFKHILTLCENWKRITLDTPFQKKENVTFYTKKCGMQQGEIKTDGNVKIIEFFLQR